MESLCDLTVGEGGSTSWLQARGVTKVKLYSWFRCVWVCICNYLKYKTYLVFCLNIAKRVQKISSFTVEKNKVASERLVIPSRFS